ncbi:hypothetical protein [Dongia sedimenti]|uniref:Uncharacterized protein n=1 Tax=Dongia sedimenti TaxID=3064282 RepID=A0ABU0YHD8_9PROT|nr:hypothetical protein [Rhodospirillaceae bacterium R-7]
MADQQKLRISLLVAVAVFMAVGMFGAVVSFDGGMRFHFENLLVALPFAALFFVILLAIRRFTPFFALPRHHASDEDGIYAKIDSVKSDRVSEGSNRAAS